MTSSLSGPINLDWQKRNGAWLAGQQRLNWNGDTFSFDASNLKTAGVTINGQASYRTDTRQASVRATTDLLGETQTLAGQWTSGQPGAFTVGGQLLKAPLALTAQIAADNRLTVQGRGLNGPIKASFDPASQQLSAQLKPVVSGVSGQLGVSGRPSDLTLSVRNAKVGQLVLNGQGQVKQGRIQATLTETGGGVLGVQGQLNDLAVSARQFKVGPLTLSGQGQLDSAGLRASLTETGGGMASLNTNRQFVGRWMVDGLSLAGISASGSGTVNLVKGLAGQLSASVPGVTSSLSGPINLDWQKRNGAWLAGQQRLNWNGDTFSLNASNLNVQDFQINGQASYRTSDRHVSGQLIASGNGVRLVASGEGQQARLSGTLRGVQVQALSDLSAPFTTRASLLGGQLSGTLSYQNGLNFQLQSGQQTVKGRLDGQNWTVNGGVDLAALRPLLGQNQPALSGTAKFALAGLGGTAQVQVSVLGGQVGGTLSRQGGIVTGQLSAQLSDLTAALGGQVYPQVQLSGPLTWRGAGGPQTVQARVSGPYGDLRLWAAGQTAAIDTGSVNLPAQALRLEGNLTPALTLNGRWGELGLTYRNGEIAASGSQQLSVAGQSGQVRVDATWQPDYSGSLSAVGQLGEYGFRASGPWTALSVDLSGAGLRATGRANARTLQYALNVSGAVSGVNVSGTLRGQKTEISGTLKASDAQGGQADIRVNSLSSFTVNARDFKLAGQTVQGQLSVVGGQLSGTAQVGPLSVRADRGRFTASGTLYGHTLDASGRLNLPSTLSELRLKVNGPYLSAQASGSGAALRGSVQLKAQRYDLAGLSAALPSQVFPLEASLSPPSVNVGGLGYAGGQWSGAATLRYALADQAGKAQPETIQNGSLRLIGDGNRLSAAPTGLLSGRATLLPQLGGTVQLDLSALEKLLPTTLPAQVSTNLVPGVLSAQLSPQGAALSLSGGRWQGEVIKLNGQVGWADKLSADAVLSLPDSRLPLQYDGQTLSLKGGLLDARVLRPFLGANTPLRGQVRADLSVPQLDFAQASGQLGVALTLGEQSASGQLDLRAGQFGGTLRSDLGGSPLTLSGALYPQADATFRFGDLRGSVQGDARSLDTRTVWTAKAAGTVQGRSLNAAATVSPQSVTLGGVLDGLRLDLSAHSGTAGAGLAGWTIGGSFNAADLTALTGQLGQLSGTLEGSLADVRAQASGQIAGVVFTVPARYQGGALTVQSATLDAALAGNQARASLSGQVYPALQLSGGADLSGQAGGHFEIGASGAYTAPRLTLQGMLDTDVLGLGIGGTRLNAALSGQDFVVTALGQSLSGLARGRTDMPGFLQTAQLTLHAPYRSTVAQLKLDGPLGWDAKRGWSGVLKVVGDAPGGALDAELSGSGSLELKASLGPAQLSGQLSASLPTTPGGSLELKTLDLGAFWQRPDLLGLSGRATLGGASWAKLSAAFSGQLTDKDNQLSGTLSGQYAAGRAELSLDGQALKGSARFDAPDFSASLDARRATLSRLLPPGLGVNSLRLTGTLKAAGSTRDGLKTLDARSLFVSGQQRELGPFNLSGSATYGGGVARAELRGQVYGGTLSAVGSFQNGLQLRAQGLNLAQYGVSAASGEVVLRGGYQNPTISGVLRASRPEGAATATLSGQLKDPSVRLKAELKGAYSGTVYADASQLDLAAQTAHLHLYGTATQKLAASNKSVGSDWVNFDLRGVWPKLSGQATAYLTSLRSLGFDEPVVLSGHGDGSYALSAGSLGSGQLSLDGLNPVVTASAVLTPLKVLGVGGQGQLNVGLSGPVSGLRLAASGTFNNLTRSGVSLPPTALSLTGPLTALRGEVRQGGQAVGTFDGQQFSFNNLQATAAGLDLTASGTATLGGELKTQISASGAVSGAATVSYTSGQLTAAGNLKAAGFGSTFEISAAQASGWRGTLQLSGGPSVSGVGPVLSAPSPLTLSGPLASPRLAGKLELVGAAAELSAGVGGAQLTLRNGPTTQASGTLSLNRAEAGYVWAGSGKLTRPEGQLDLALSGAAADPRAQLKFRRGQWTAQGEASLRTADLSVSDGQHQGKLTYDGKALSLSAPLLDLSGLDIGNLSGRVSAVGAFSTDLNGSASLSFSDLSSGAVLPYFELPLTGSGSAQVKFAGGVGQVQAQVQAPYGQATLSLQQTGAGKSWAGRLKGQLQKGAGRLSADVTLDDSGAGGQVTLQNLPIQAANLQADLNGTVTLSAQSFTLEGEAVSPMGRADVSGDGNLADIVPALSQYTVLKPSEAGYRVQAGVSSFDLAQLKLGAGIGGTVSGQLTLSQGSGSFVVRSAALKLGDASFPSRIDGTLAGGDWRLRGYVGNSTLFGAVTAGQLSVRSQLEALPVGNIIAGFTGKLPGNGIVTGIARLDAPLSDPLSGSVNLVAERVRVTAGQDTLVGSGTLDFRNRELREINFQLSGAGQWDISGQFTHQNVDLKAAFTDTTFTPVLAFVPSLSDLSPALKGSLTLSVGGSYAQPTASLSGSNLVGSVSGLNVTLPSLRGSLGSGGQLTAQAAVQAAGSISGVGTLSASGQLSGSRLSGAALRYLGSLSADALGNLGTLDASVLQAQDAWTVSATAQQGGNLKLSGQISPSFDLTLAARAYNLPIRSIYARESSLSGDLSAKSSSEQILVGGNLSFERLILGRLGASSLPGTTSGTASSGAASSYVSPLPDELTVFPSEKGEKPPSPFLQRVVFQDIPIRAPNGIRVDENLAQAELSAALTLSGSGAAPRLSGNVRSLRGNLLLRENNFNLQNAQADFDGSSLYPVFRLTAQGRVADQAAQSTIGVQLQVNGSFVVQSGVRALQLATELSCTTCADAGQYSQAELYSLLALGTPDITTVGSSIGSLGQSAVSTALNVFVLGELQRNIARALGVDVFRISSNLITPEGNLDAKFTVGTYLSKQFYVQYQVDLTGKGLFDATYTTPDNRFTFRASTPISGLDLQSVRPSFSVGYNLGARSSLTLGVQSGLSTRFSVGYLYRW
ncbi:translocation/assembly module TamB domain-containing protein [Deinococcus alpinitundrae]|uniref:translocation/assembly module TamB domain-containing protein n=1 Tax=Deinococcus alpinitundrae TaxID=468913 RepID=UPI001ED9281C|nr:translocation/assembly module TamB domain-containing protein [Deinococcus alpinitundrae]